MSVYQKMESLNRALSADLSSALIQLHLLLSLLMSWGPSNTSSLGGDASFGAGGFGSFLGPNFTTGGGGGVTYKLISLFIVREERSLLLLLVLDKCLEEDSIELVAQGPG